MTSVCYNKASSIHIQGHIARDIEEVAWYFFLLDGYDILPGWGRLAEIKLANFAVLKTHD